MKDKKANKGMSLGILLTLLLSIGTLSLQSMVQAAHTPPDFIFVDNVTCVGPGTGTSADPFCTIQDAVAHALDGDTVSIAAGTYDEQVIIDEDITIQGA